MWPNIPLVVQKCQKILDAFINDSTEKELKEQFEIDRELQRHKKGGPAVNNDDPSSNARKLTVEQKK